MAANEFERIEVYLRNLETLKNYPQVKEERDSLAVEVPKLKEKIAQLKTQLETEISTKKGLSSRLTKTAAEAKELTSRLSEVEKELSSLREFKAKFAEGMELTLEEMRDQFLQAEKDEIERRVKECRGALEEDMRSRMPTLVHKSLIKVLKSSEWPP